MALLEPRNKNTEVVLEQVRALSANRLRAAEGAATHNDALPDSETLITAMNKLANSWMKA
ncbi:hypothetical protein CJO92_22535 (plasmid) [Ralstonia solanacearum]|uniref:Uncharacterized protein n=1 Tax=Ralstonia solanacearum TaxID=305 RepID=A0AAD0WJC7_RALSL|nr:hypothetical protein CJO77_22525 [Ralstonia solanacearum]AXW55898.1 hypothetical protein CJO92_22535 [Ralstonia solanacearum]CBJ35597.1 conserved hypothethical protein [Ralstonia solanacearum PSI07]